MKIKSSSVTVSYISTTRTWLLFQSFLVQLTDIGMLMVKTYKIVLLMNKFKKNEQNLKEIYL